MLALINKETLHAICESKQVTCTYIARETRFIKDKIEKWTDPSDSLRPTFLQAKKIARCLHVPFAGLYMCPADVPLHKLPKIKNYRTIPKGSSADDSSLNIAVADLLQAKRFYVETKAELGEAIQSFSVRINARYGEILRWAQEIRNVFELDLDTQFHTTSPRKFYLYVRQRIERQGIFVHCFTDVDLEIARAVALYDDTTPIIGINEDDRPPAKTFSIIHELTHILKRQSSLCNEMYSSFTQNQEEVFCNAVAGEVLMPQGALKVFLKKWKSDETLSVEHIQEIADRFSVSKEATIRRLLEIGRIEQTTYTAYLDEFRRNIEREREEQRLARKEGHAQGIPRIPYREAIDRTSSELCRMLFRGYAEELFSKQDVSRYLGIGQQYVDKFLREVSSWPN
jgi:Zn-dependent peptidase ImmA (M78 family)